MMETIQQPTETKANKDHRCNFCTQAIPKGSTYLKSTHKQDGDVYTWKAHEHCEAIASKLKMFEHCHDGVDADAFMETITHEYQNIMINHHTVLYTSKEFAYPKFSERMTFVLNHHSINHYQ